MLKFVNPSTSIVKNGIHGIIEVALRGASIVLSLISIIAASVYFGVLSNLCTFLKDSKENNPQNPRGNCDEFKLMVSTVSSSRTRTVSFDQKSAAGFVIFASILVIIYQILALLQLFLNFKILHIKIPILKSFWTLFFIIDVIATAIFALFFFSGAVAVAVLADKKWKDLVNLYRSERGIMVYVEAADQIQKVYSASIAVAVFVFITMLLFIGIVVYFALVKLLSKSHTHGAAVALQSSEEEESSELAK